jgi:hypothetical protein
MLAIRWVRAGEFGSAPKVAASEWTRSLLVLVLLVLG